MSVKFNGKKERKGQAGQPLFHALESIEREATFKAKTPEKNCCRLIRLKCIAFSSFSRQWSSLSFFSPAIGSFVLAERERFWYSQLVLPMQRLRTLLALQDGAKGLIRCILLLAVVTVHQEHFEAPTIIECLSAHLSEARRASKVPLHWFPYTRLMLLMTNY